jgi:integrase
MKVTYIERTPGTWRLRIEGGRGTDGRRQFSYETIRGAKEDAERRRFEILHAHEEGTWAKPDKILFGAFLDRWVEQRRALGVICRTTAEKQEQMLRWYIKPALGGKRLQAVTGSEIQSIYTDLLTKPTRLREHLNPSVVRLLHQTLVTAFKGARKAKLIKTNPMEEVTPPPLGRRSNPKALDMAGVAKALQELRGHWLEPIAIVGFAGGMRRGELCGLKWRHVAANGTTVRVEGQVVQYYDRSLEWKVPKSESGVRNIALPPEAADVLRRLRRDAIERSMGAGFGGKIDDAYVFTRDGANPLTPDNLTGSFAEFFDAHGLPDFTLHGTRHTHATALLKAVGREGAKAVSQRLGHADVMVTLSVYQTVFEEDDVELGDMASGIFGNGKGTKVR